MAREYQKHRLVASDSGEEADDQFAILEEIIRATHNPNTHHLAVLFTNKARFGDETNPKNENETYYADRYGTSYEDLLGKSVEISEFKYLLGGKDFENNNIKFVTLDNLGPRQQGGKHSLLQIGPNDDKIETELVAYFKGETNYDYTLLGIPGTTNAKGNFVKLWNGTEGGARHIVHTANGDGAFKFTMRSIEDRLDQPDAIAAFGESCPCRDRCKSRMQHLAASIGFRNLVGRADPGAGKWIAHLVAAHRKGANFMTAFKVAQKIFPEDCQNIASALNLMEKKASACDILVINRIVDDYVGKLVSAGAKFDQNVLSNGSAAVTRAEIEAGYAFILWLCHDQLSVPLKYYASGRAQDWNPQWLRMELFNDEGKMEVAYQKWVKVITDKNVATSPAYDVVGGRFSRGDAAYRKENFIADTIKDHDPTDTANVAKRAGVKEGGYNFPTAMEGGVVHMMKQDTISLSKE